jgi:N-acetylglucosaminyldiphosphoundecaprenol N-acetyl-beta-D-mannosaminyltransferase
MPIDSKIFGVTFSSLTHEEIVTKVTLETIVKSAGSRIIFTANLDHIVQLRLNDRLRRAYGRAWVVTADGMPVFLYAKARGAAIPMRVTGADLCTDILGTLLPRLHRCFFVASSDETAHRLVAALLVRGFQRAAIDFSVPPHGFEYDIANSDALASRIRRHHTTHLFLGVGAPTSEIWAYEYRDRLGDCYVLSVGAGLDFFAGTQKRAPRALQQIGFEWLWRFGHNPRRLFRRYFITSWSFIAAVAEDLFEPDVAVGRGTERWSRNVGKPVLNSSGDRPVEDRDFTSRA